MWGHRNRLDVRVGTEIDLVSVMGSKLTWFSCTGSKLMRVGVKIDFGFYLRVENYLVLIYRSKLTWFLAWGSKLAWFLCAGRK